AALFTQTDRCHYRSQVPLRHLVMPVLFRTIYACGLRCSEARLADLRRLELGDLDWRAKRITIVQCKTGRPLSLPLLDDVGWAIIDYVKYVLGAAKVGVTHVAGQVGQHHGQVHVVRGPSSQVGDGEAMAQRVRVRAAGEVGDAGIGQGCTAPPRTKPARTSTKRSSTGSTSTRPTTPQPPPKTA
ncbi:MAG: hypothetical protein ACRDRK_14265, partial [Pseudonocardia sp.]